MTGVSIAQAGRAEGRPPVTTASGRRYHGLLGRILREPLLHFLLTGALLVLAARVHADATDQRRIVVDAARAAQIEQTWRLQYGSSPPPAVREDLIRRWIEEEALYREGVARRLDRDDEIIRRRVVQKMQFLSEDLAAPAAPGETALRDYYRTHAARYETAERVSFSHVFFSPDERGDEGARAAAARLLGTLPPAVARAPEQGDRFADRYDYADLSEADAARLFGRSPIAAALFAAPVGQWSGPYRSGFGWHLVRVAGRTPAKLAPFEAVTGRVRADAEAEARAAADGRALADLERNYVVVRADRNGRR